MIACVALAWVATQHERRALVDAAERRGRALVELMPLVRALASRYAGRGEALEDLVQVGSIGLIKAVDRFFGVWNGCQSRSAAKWRNSACNSARFIPASP